jgi:hypothetical protein
MWVNLPDESSHFELRVRYPTFDSYGLENSIGGYATQLIAFCQSSVNTAVCGICCPHILESTHLYITSFTTQLAGHSPLEP